MVEFTDADGVLQTFDLDNLGEHFYHADCMELLKALPDKCFDLAVVDPPYGSGGASLNEQTSSDSVEYSISIHNPLLLSPAGGAKQNMESIRGMVRQVQTISRTGGTWATKFGKKIISWDHAPGDDYFNELFRVSKEQIIWGDNYFSLPPNRCFLVWRKTNIPENFSMAMAEYAWCSFNDNAKVFDYNSQGIPGRFHPTQKPIELYSWIFEHYAKSGDKILDTHVGSASSLIAAHDAGLQFVGCELDSYYYDLAKKRLDEHTAQMSIFDLGVERGDADADDTQG